MRLHQPQFARKGQESFPEAPAPLTAQGLENLPHLSETSCKDVDLMDTLKVPHSVILLEKNKVHHPW